MSDEGSGWPEFDDALEGWRSATAALPSAFRVELLEALDAVEHGRLVLEWPSPDAERRDLVARFPHPFAGVYDHTMFYLSVSLGLSGPLVRMEPVGGVILRRHLGGIDGQGSASTAIDDPVELAQLRALLAHVTSTPSPGPASEIR
jgi:hypothetical protein